MELDGKVCKHLYKQYYDLTDLALFLFCRPHCADRRLVSSTPSPSVAATTTTSCFHHPLGCRHHHNNPWLLRLPIVCRHRHHHHHHPKLSFYHPSIPLGRQKKRVHHPLPLCFHQHQRVTGEEEEEEEEGGGGQRTRGEQKQEGWLISNSKICNKSMHFNTTVLQSFFLHADKKTAK